MKYLLDTLSVLLLALLALQDFKYRGISWYLLPLLFISLLMQALTSNSFQNIVFWFALNLLFVFLQMVLLLIYFGVKEKRFVNIINTKIGIGDILFFIVIGVSFSNINFIFFYLLGLLFTLLAVLVYYLISRKPIGDIPLAGSIALLLIICIFCRCFYTPFNFYDDAFLLHVFLPSP